jgi:hypothetical protein
VKRSVDGFVGISVRRGVGEAPRFVDFIAKSLDSLNLITLKEKGQDQTIYKRKDAEARFTVEQKDGGTIYIRFETDDSTAPDPDWLLDILNAYKRVALHWTKDCGIMIVTIPVYAI